MAIIRRRRQQPRRNKQWTKRQLNERSSCSSSFVKYHWQLKSGWKMTKVHRKMPLVEIHDDFWGVDFRCAFFCPERSSCSSSWKWRTSPSRGPTQANILERIDVSSDHWLVRADDLTKLVPIELRPIKVTVHVDILRIHYSQHSIVYSVIWYDMIVLCMYIYIYIYNHYQLLWLVLWLLSVVTY